MVPHNQLQNPAFFLRSQVYNQRLTLIAYSSLKRTRIHCVCGAQPMGSHMHCFRFQRAFTDIPPQQSDNDGIYMPLCLDFSGVHHGKKLRQSHASTHDYSCQTFVLTTLPSFSTGSVLFCLYSVPLCFFILHMYHILFYHCYC